MNNSINVQSPSFGMAHSIHDIKKLRVAINSLTIKERHKLATELKEAAEN